MPKSSLELESVLTDKALELWVRLRFGIIMARACDDKTDPRAQANIASAVGRRQNINNSLTALAEALNSMNSDGQNADKN